MHPKSQLLFKQEQRSSVFPTSGCQEGLPRFLDNIPDISPENIL